MKLQFHSSFNNIFKRWNTYKLPLLLFFAIVDYARCWWCWHIFVCWHENLMSSAQYIQILLSPIAIISTINFEVWEFKLESISDHLSTCWNTHCYFELICTQSMQLNECNILRRLALLISNNAFADMSIRNILQMTPLIGTIGGTLLAQKAHSPFSLYSAVIFERS